VELDLPFGTPQFELPGHDERGLDSVGKYVSCRSFSYERVYFRCQE
jgi:hypothetical protein